VSEPYYSQRARSVCVSVSAFFTVRFLRFSSLCSTVKSDEINSTRDDSQASGVKACSTTKTTVRTRFRAVDAASRNRRHFDAIRRPRTAVISRRQKYRRRHEQRGRQWDGQDNGTDSGTEWQRHGRADTGDVVVVVLVVVVIDNFIVDCRPSRRPHTSRRRPDQSRLSVLAAARASALQLATRTLRRCRGCHRRHPQRYTHTYTKYINVIRPARHSPQHAT